MYVYVEIMWTLRTSKLMANFETEYFRFLIGKNKNQILVSEFDRTVVH